MYDESSSPRNTFSRKFTHIWIKKKKSFYYHFKVGIIISSIRKRGHVFVLKSQKKKKPVDKNKITLCPVLRDFEWGWVEGVESEP